MTRLTDLLWRHATPLLWVVGLSTLVSQAWLAADVLALEPSPLALQFTWQPEAYLGVLQAWGATGQAAFRDLFAHESLQALLYAALGALVAASPMMAGWSPGQRWLLGLQLPLACVAHLSENGIELLILRALQEHAVQAAAGWVPWAVAFSMLKWAAVTGFGALLARRLAQHGVERLIPALELRLRPGLVMTACAAAIWAVAWAWPPPAWSDAQLGALTAASLALWAAGAAFAWLGLNQRRRALVRRTHGGDGDATSLLITRGVYRISRNPVYLGFTLMLCGWALWLGQPAGLVLVPVFALVVQRLQIVPEERALESRFGPAFRIYAEQVRRWL